MRNKIFIIFLAVFLLATGLGEVAASAENPYNISNFINTNTHGFWPDYHNDTIIFLSGLSQNNETVVGIWIMNDTLGKQLLYANDSIDYTFTGPKFSPDGEKIVFTKRIVVVPSKKVDMTIEILEKNGTRWNSTEPKEIYLVHNNGLKNPSFSPDGKKIVYFSNEAGGDGDVWVMDIGGTNRTQLTFDKDGGKTPSYSPDGKKIVYERWSENDESEIWIMNSDGTDKKRILDDSWYPINPTFMPDGNILFESARYSPHSKGVGAPGIWMMEPDGSNKTLLAPARISSVGSKRPTINRNGTRIAFEHGSGDSFRIHYVEDPDGDGIWEDLDGDHVADICDGYPDDPNRGYIKDDDENGGFLPGFGGEVIVFSFLVAIPVVWWLRKR